MRHGRWWTVIFRWHISLGFHLEPRVRRTATDGISYGPYLDIHLPCCVVSVGNRPIYAGADDLRLPYSRGGLRAEAS